MATSLAKNTAIFHKLPNGMVGLKEWYPDAIERKKGFKKIEPNGAEEKGDEKDETVSE